MFRVVNYQVSKSDSPSTTFSGILKPFGEYVPLMNDTPIIMYNSQKNIFEQDFIKVPYFFGSLEKDMKSMKDCYHLSPVVTRVGAYDYKLFIERGFIIDFKSQQPLICLAVVKEYEKDIKTQHFDSYKVVPVEKLTLCVHRQLKNTSFFRAFIKLYPYLKDKVLFLPTLEGFLDRLNVSNVKGDLSEHQKNIIKKFLADNKIVDESILSGQPS